MLVLTDDEGVVEHPCLLERSLDTTHAVIHARYNGGYGAPVLIFDVLEPIETFLGRLYSCNAMDRRRRGRRTRR